MHQKTNYGQISRAKLTGWTDGGTGGRQTDNGYFTNLKPPYFLRIQLSYKTPKDCDNIHQDIKYLVPSHIH